MEKEKKLMMGFIILLVAFAILQETKKEGSILCDPSAGICTEECSLLYNVEITTPWLESNGNCDSEGSFDSGPAEFVVAGDAFCDSYEVLGTDGPCTIYGSGWNCPSAERIGREVTVNDCCDVRIWAGPDSCYPTNPNVPIDNFNLEHEFYTEGFIVVEPVLETNETEEIIEEPVEEVTLTGDCDPTIPICSPGCSNIFSYSLPSNDWSYNPIGICSILNRYTNFLVGSDAYCDSNYNTADGLCARFSGPTDSIPSYNLYCPSYERNGNVQTTASDCQCTAQNCISPDLAFDFSDDFFSGGIIVEPVTETNVTEPVVNETIIETNITEEINITTETDMTQTNESNVTVEETVQVSAPSGGGGGSSSFFCECTDWADLECVGEVMNQTRECYPFGCDNETRMVENEICVEPENDYLILMIILSIILWKNKDKIRKRFK